MMFIKAVGCFISAAILCACGFLMRREDIPARIVNPTDESRAELQAAVSEALRGVSVTLADDALTRSNRLMIERKQHKDAAGNRLMGRETDMPRQFYLVISKKRCVLIYDRDGSRRELKQTTCQPLPQP